MSRLFNKITVSLLFLVFIIVCCLFLFSQQGWNKYYTKKLYLPPSQVTQNAVNLFSKTGLAIDFGCGCGNDSAFLLQNGWTVWAIDGEPLAIEILKKRKDISQQSLLFANSERFEEINWNNLPKVDLFLAVNALPFCKKEKFKEVWSHLTETIQPQGRFAGHFFGPRYQGFTDKERQLMTFLSKEEVLELFKDFDIEFFDEKEEAGKSGTGREIYSHIFEVIAKKR